jgi:hypothetical protein
MVSLMSIPPEDMFCTKSFFNCSSLEKRYAARGFGFDFITSKLSSKFSTWDKPEESQTISSYSVSLQALLTQL